MLQPYFTKKQIQKKCDLQCFSRMHLFAFAKLETYLSVQTQTNFNTIMSQHTKI